MAAPLRRIQGACFALRKAAPISPPPCALPWVPAPRRSVTSFVVMAVVVAVTVASKAAKHSPYLLRTLRATAKLSSTSLFLPWTSMLLQALGCDQGVWWGGAGVECYG